MNAKIYRDYYEERKARRIRIILLTILLVGAILLAKGCNSDPVWAEEIILKASWYSIESLKKEGTYKYSKGRCADGSIFNENDFTCASRLFPLHCYLRITELKTGRTVIVKVTDRIGKRFAKTRIDLSRSAMEALGGKQALIQGLIQVRVERIN